MSRKSIFFTSDQHFGHESCIRFDKRPFKSLEHMNETLIRNYNAVVPENGVCYFLGDFGMGNVEFLKDVVSQLNGTKILVLGNHDRNHNAMYTIGFDIVVNSCILYIAGERVSLSHCPLPGVFREDVTGMRNVQGGENWHGEFKQHKFMVKDEGQFHLHGHIHSTKENIKEVRTDRQWDIGVPGNNYRPVSISAVESWISKEKLK